MMDLHAKLEKLRAEAAEAAIIRDLATDRDKRALYTRLAERLAALADEVELAIRAAKCG
jgi:hypothetical protein